MQTYNRGTWILLCLNSKYTKFVSEAPYTVGVQAVKAADEKIANSLALNHLPRVFIRSFHLIVFINIGEKIYCNYSAIWKKDKSPNIILHSLFHDLKICHKQKKLQK